jgi:hypothetical protein
MNVERPIHANLKHVSTLPQSIKNGGLVSNKSVNARIAPTDYNLKEYYLDIARKRRMSSDMSEFYMLFMRERFRYVHDSYANEWAARFNNGTVWKYADYRSKKILMKIGFEFGMSERDIILLRDGGIVQSTGFAELESGSLVVPAKMVKTLMNRKPQFVTRRGQPGWFRGGTVPALIHKGELIVPPKVMAGRVMTSPQFVTRRGQPGWFRESRRHSLAVLKGLRQRRR